MESSKITFGRHTHCHARDAFSLLQCARGIGDMVVLTAFKLRTYSVVKESFFFAIDLIMKANGVWPYVSCSCARVFWQEFARENGGKDGHLMNMKKSDT